MESGDRPPLSSKPESMFHKQHLSTTAGGVGADGREESGREIKIPSMLK